MFHRFLELLHSDSQSLFQGRGKNLTIIRFHVGECGQSVQNTSDLSVVETVLSYHK